MDDLQNYIDKKIELLKKSEEKRENIIENLDKFGGYLTRVNQDIADKQELIDAMEARMTIRREAQEELDEIRPQIQKELEDYRAQSAGDRSLPEDHAARFARLEELLRIIERTPKEIRKLYYNR